MNNIKIFHPEQLQPMTIYWISEIMATELMGSFPTGYDEHGGLYLVFDKDSIYPYHELRIYLAQILKKEWFR